MDSMEMIQHLANSLSILICFVDKDEIYRFVNNEYGKYFEMSPEEITDKKIFEVLGKQGYSKIKDKIPLVLSGRELKFEVDMPTAIGVRTLFARYVPHFESKEKTDGWWVLAEDISHVKELEKEKEKALSENQTLKNSITVCADCGEFLNDSASIDRLNKFISENEKSDFKEGICDHCIKCK